MSIKILPYKGGSASVKKLKIALNAVVIKTKNSRYRNRESHVVINWGSSRRPASLEGVKMLNDPEEVAIATNKLSTLETLEEAGVSVVPFTTSMDEGAEWLEEGHKVFVRNTLTGHSGEGIEVVEPEARDEAGMFAIQESQRLLSNADLDELADALDEDYQLLAEGKVNPVLQEAPLYTQAVSNKGEYRVHVMGGEVILYQKKSRRLNEDGEVDVVGGEEADVRNLESNWVYRTGNLNRLERIEELAIEAIEALGLDFGAVDIINNHDNEVFVLEVNTAVGIGNQDTLDAYVEGFNKLNWINMGLLGDLEPDYTMERLGKIIDDII